MNGPVRQKDSGNKDQQRTMRQRKKRIKKRNLELSCRDAKAEGEPVSLGPGPPQAK